MNVINPRQALALLRKGESLQDYELRFDEEKLEVQLQKIEALEALLLARHGYPVPEALIYYDEESIEEEDNPGLTDEDLEQGRLRRVYRLELALEKDLADWVKESGIDLQELLGGLLRGYYEKWRG